MVPDHRCAEASCVSQDDVPVASDLVLADRLTVPKTRHRETSLSSRPSPTIPVSPMGTPGRGIHTRHPKRLFRVVSLLMRRYTERVYTLSRHQGTALC